MWLVPVRPAGMAACADGRSAAAAGEQPQRPDSAAGAPRSRSSPAVPEPGPSAGNSGSPPAQCSGMSCCQASGRPPCSAQPPQLPLHVLQDCPHCNLCHNHNRFRMRMRSRPTKPFLVCALGHPSRRSHWHRAAHRSRTAPPKVTSMLPMMVQQQRKQRRHGEGRVERHLMGRARTMLRADLALVPAPIQHPQPLPP